MKCVTVTISTKLYNCLSGGYNITEAKQHCIRQAMNIEELTPVINEFIAKLDKAFCGRKDVAFKFVSQLLSGKFDKII